jgi:hypothetical protein
MSRFRLLTLSRLFQPRLAFGTVAAVTNCGSIIASAASRRS